MIALDTSTMAGAVAECSRERIVNGELIPAHTARSSLLVNPDRTSRTPVR